MRTKGPWTWRDAWASPDGKMNPCRLAGADEETVLRSDFNSSDIRVSREDGNLIASSPDLLAACEAFIEADNHDGIQLAYAMARAAIAKATRQPTPSTDSQIDALVKKACDQ